MKNIFQSSLLLIMSFGLLTIGFFTVTKTKMMLDYLLNINGKSWYYTKTKFGRNQFQRLKERNEKGWFLLEQKIVGVGFIVMGFMLLMVLIGKWVGIVS